MWEADLKRPMHVTPLAWQAFLSMATFGNKRHRHCTRQQSTAFKAVAALCTRILGRRGEELARDVFPGDPVTENLPTLLRLALADQVWCITQNSDVRICSKVML